MFEISRKRHVFAELLGEVYPRRHHPVKPLIEIGGQVRKVLRVGLKAPRSVDIKRGLLLEDYSADQKQIQFRAVDFKKTNYPKADAIVIRASGELKSLKRARLPIDENRGFEIFASNKTKTNIALDNNGVSVPASVSFIKPGKKHRYDD